MTRGMNGLDIKRSNRGLFLKNIALNKANSRIELSKLTGLTKMTAGNIVQELLNMGLIEVSETIRVDSTGPNPQQLKISENAPKIIGIYLSRDDIVFSLGNLSGEIIFSHKTPLENETAQTISQKLVLGVKQIITKTTDEILALGVAMIGPINNEGAIVNSPNFFGIDLLPVKQILRESFPYPIIIYNDISAAAVAEQLIGNCTSANFVFIGNSNGLGAGIIYNSELMTSANSFLGEFGHITINSKGEKCPCGNVGCLELYASHSLLINRLSDEVGHKVTSNEFEELSLIPSCDTIFSDMAEKLAFGMVTLTNLLSPEAFILGYGSYHLPDKYIKAIEQKINATKFLKGNSQIKVLKAGCKADSAVYGSIACVLREVFKGKILFNK